jgi:nucleotide-binding universal stress UspA family protein
MSARLEPVGPVVVGVERSERSRDALALGRALARAAGTRLLLVAIYAADARSAMMERGAYARALAIEAESVLEWVARPLAGVSAETRAVPCASVPRGLQEVAEAEGALAIVVGASHRGALGRIVPGSVGERLLHGARCPVAVAPRGYWAQAFAGIKRIGVGYVGVPEAQDALAAAVGLAARTGAAVHVLSVIEPTAVSGSLPLGSSSDRLEPTVRADLARSQQRAIEAVPAPIEITGEVADGYADDELARLSREVDFLVCGSRGHGPAGSVMLGCVSSGVLRKARCPVLVVPRGARDGFAALRTPAPAAAVA